MGKRKGTPAAPADAEVAGQGGLLALHRSRFVEWSPTAVVAMAANGDGSATAVARESGAIEVWDSYYWHCFLTIPGHKDAAITSLAWIGGAEGKIGRLISAGLEGTIVEWDLETRKPRSTTDSYGGAVWGMAVEPEVSYQARGDDDTRLIAVACDDGCVRLFGLDPTEADSRVEYQRTCSKVQGRMLSVAWRPDGQAFASGSSDGCLRLWDASTCMEALRITVGDGSGTEMCVWAVAALPDGSVASGDAGGNTQIWDGQFGTLLHIFKKHEADVLALAASPCGGYLFSAGVDAQVALFERLPGDGPSDPSKWVYTGYKRSHTHDVRALCMAPGRGSLGAKGLLLSGGNDAVMYSYPAMEFLQTHPTAVCAHPERPAMALARQAGAGGGGGAGDGPPLLLVQQRDQVDVWALGRPVGGAGPPAPPPTPAKGKAGAKGGGRKGGRNGGAGGGAAAAGGPSAARWTGKEGDYLELGDAPTHVARIRARGPGHIACSAISPCGKMIAYSDVDGVCVFHLAIPEGGGEAGAAPGGGRGGAGARLVKQRLLRPLPAATALAFSPDSGTLCVAAGSGRVVLAACGASAEAWGVRAELTGHLGGAGVLDADAHGASGGRGMSLLAMSADGQWLAAAGGGRGPGRVHLFSLEGGGAYHGAVTVPPEGSRARNPPVTALALHPSRGLLLAATATRSVHLFDSEALDLAPWSQAHKNRLPRRLLRMRGPVTGACFALSEGSEAALLHTPAALCRVDFGKELPEDAPEPKRRRPEEVPGAALPTAGGGGGVGGGAAAAAAAGGGAAAAAAAAAVRVLPLEHPCLLLQYTAADEALLVERPWAEVLRTFPAPLYRHVYGS